MKIASTTPCATGPIGIGRSHCVAVRSTRSRTNAASTTPISTSASAASTFGRNRTPSLSDRLRNCKPEQRQRGEDDDDRQRDPHRDGEHVGERAAEAGALEHVGDAVALGGAVEAGHLAGRGAAAARPPDARMIPTTSSSSAPPRRGMKPPSWLPALVEDRGERQQRGHDRSPGRRPSNNRTLSPTAATSVPTDRSGATTARWNRARCTTVGGERWVGGRVLGRELREELLGRCSAGR